MNNKNLNDEEIQKRIIFSLHRGSYYNKRHTPKKTYVKDYQPSPVRELTKTLKNYIRKEL